MPTATTGLPSLSLSLSLSLSVSLSLSLSLSLCVCARVCGSLTFAALIDCRCMHFINTALKDARLVPHNQDPTRATYLIAETTAEERAPQGYGEVRAGGVVAWSGATIHGSNANASGRWRRAFAVHFLRHGATMRAGVPEPDLSELNDAHAARL